MNAGSAIETVPIRKSIPLISFLEARSFHPVSDRPSAEGNTVPPAVRDTDSVDIQSARPRRRKTPQKSVPGSITDRRKKEKRTRTRRIHPRCASVTFAESEEGARVSRSAIGEDPRRQRDSHDLRGSSPRSEKGGGGASGRESRAASKLKG